MSKPSLERNMDVPLEVIKELLTESEWRMVKQRLLIIQLLKEGLSIRKVAERAKVGSDTVVRIARKLEAQPRLRQLLFKRTATPSSKWVFGNISPEK